MKQTAKQAPKQAPRGAAKRASSIKSAKTCNARLQHWGSQLAAEQVRMLTEFNERGVLRPAASHAIECHACHVAPGEPCSDS